MSLFIQNDQQRQWMEKIGRIADEFQQTAAEDDEQGRFPAEKIQKLRDAGYTALTLPVSHGGGAFLFTICSCFKNGLHGEMLLRLLASAGI